MQAVQTSLFNKVFDVNLDYFPFRGKELKNKYPCPHCGQLIQVYCRKIHSSVVKSLIALYQMCRVEAGVEPRWVHYKDFAEATDYAILTYWGLIEKRPLEMTQRILAEGREKSGQWRITFEGAEFLRNERAIPKQVFIYNNEVLGFSTDRVIASEILGNKYFELEEIFDSE